MQYDDFVIQLVPKGDQEFWVTVRGSTAGDNDGVFRLPFEPEEIRSLRRLLGQAVRGKATEIRSDPLRDVEPAVPGRDPTLNLQQIGDRLFRALFTDDIRSLFDRSLGSAQQGHGLRIRIHLDPDNVDLARLCSLPWELLFWKAGREFLSLCRTSPVVRSLATPRPSLPPELELPLRILVAVSSPLGYPPLDVEREQCLIQGTWGQLTDVEVRFLKHPTLTNLRDELLNGGFHILHYIGHGNFDKTSGEGGLVFVNGLGFATTAPGRSMANALRNLPSLRLVYLNACNTAEAEYDSEIDPFAGVAAALVRAGVPEVLAMQFPISDQAAIAFSQKFYERLASGDPIEAATVEGRLELYSQDADSTEWVTPVLFLRAPNGSLLNPDSMVLRSKKNWSHKPTADSHEQNSAKFKEGEGSQNEQVAPENLVIECSTSPGRTERIIDYLEKTLTTIKEVTEGLSELSDQE